jgi:8-oxo-dGTP diphosphatase
MTCPQGLFTAFKVGIKVVCRPRPLQRDTPDALAKLSPTLHPAHPLKRIDAAIALVTRNGQLLICQRKADDTFGGLWEFPGGKREEGETLHQCLERELREELNIRARPITQLTTIEHHYPHALVRLHPFVCAHVDGEVEHLECQASCWIDPHQLHDYNFPPANESLIAEAIEYFARRSDLSGEHSADRIIPPKGD